MPATRLKARVRTTPRAPTTDAREGAVVLSPTLPRGRSDKFIMRVNDVQFRCLNETGQTSAAKRRGSVTRTTVPSPSHSTNVPGAPASLRE